MRTACLAGASALLAACAISPSTSPSGHIAVGGDSPLASLFVRVATDTGVPAELLAAVSWSETRFHFAQPTLSSHAREIGLLGLTDGGARDIARGARLAGVTDEAAHADPEASIRAGAALLRAAAPSARTIEDFAPALRAFGGDRFAHSIQQALARGIDGRDDDGRAIVVAARPETHAAGFGQVTQGVNYPGAEWEPAYSGNYQTANRGVGDITNIVIHDTEGSFDGAIGWFQDPAAQVSAHYVVRSRDGHIAQMVAEKNIAWHDACFNTHTIGIEHEGYEAKPAQWYTEAMYVESAKLTAYLADKYGIEKKHGPILGHGEAPDCSDHTDPGPGWNWEHYIELVQTGGAAQWKAQDVVVTAPDTLVSGEVATVTVTATNNGTAAWDLDATRIGTQDPQDRDSEFFVDGDWVATNRATAVDAHTDVGAPGSFTFQIKAPDVAEPTVYDEAFGIVEEGVTWFGQTFHVVVQVKPAGPDVGEHAGCNAGRGSGSGLIVCMLALGAAILPRRRRGR